MNPFRLASDSDARRVALYGSVCLALLPWPASGQTDERGPFPSRGQVAAQATDFLAEDVAPLVAEAKLSRRNQRKADALASFVEGAIAESGAEADRALAKYREVLNADPGATITTPEGEELLLSVKVAYELARRGEISEGIGILKDSIKAVPDDPIAYLYLAQLYSRYLQKPDLALQYARKAIDLEPTRLETYQALYEVYVAEGELAKAEEVLDRAAKVETDDPQFWADLGELYRLLLTPGEGVPDESKVAKMDAVFTRALELSASDADVMAKVADYYVLTDRLGQAVPLYEGAVAENSKSAAPAVLDLRDKLARSYLATDQREKAIEEYQAITRLNPLRHESYEMLGQLHEDAGDWDRALASYEQSLLLAPNQPMNYLRIAGLQQQTHRFDQAVETLTEARKRFPDLPRVTYMLAFALTQAKRHQEAVTAYEEAMHEAGLMQDEMLDGEFYFNYGVAAEQAGLEDKAIELMRKSISLDPENAGDAYNYIGYLWVDAGRHLEEAGEMIRKALELKPENPAYIDSLGWYYYRTGRYKEALAELLRAAQLLEPPDPVVYDHIGDTYARLDNIAQALIYWQKADALEGADPGIAAKIESAKKKLTALPEGRGVKP